MEKTVHYPAGTDIDSDDFRQAIRMETHLAGWEVIDFGHNGHDGRPYVTFRKKATRLKAAPKQRFFT